MKKIAEENQALYRDPTEANLEAAFVIPAEAAIASINSDLFMIKLF